VDRTRKPKRDTEFCQVWVVRGRESRKPELIEVECKLDSCGFYRTKRTLRAAYVAAQRHDRRHKRVEQTNFNS